MGTAQYLAAALGNLRHISVQLDRMARSTTPLHVGLARELRPEVDRAVAAVIIAMARAPDDAPTAAIPPSPSSAAVRAGSTPAHAPARR